jgi:RNA polymerase sigma-70 factor (ECF subfamily)
LQPDLERELIRKCKAGNTRFYEPVVKAYEPSGMSLAFALLGNIDDAQDALQEAFIKAYRSLNQFDLDQSFSPWFFQILRNQCRDILRGRKADSRMERLDERFELRSTDTEGEPETILQRNIAADTLWRGLKQISEEHREIIVLKEIQGFPYSEIASILNIPEGTVASRLYQARHALRDVLLDIGTEDKKSS